MTTFYTLRFTDPSKTPFVVNPLTSDGPASPNGPGFPPGTISANTTLRLLGRGSFDYGEPIQQDLIYMLENFANNTAPSYPVEGQLWYRNDVHALFVYNGATWDSLVLSGGFIANLDMNGFGIINLANPVLSTDALNLGYADTRYVNIAGDTMTGSLTLSGGTSHVILPNAPSLGTHATNKTYVDTEIVTQVTAEVASQLAVALAPIPSTYVDVAGDTMTGTLTLSSGDVVVTTGDVIVPIGNITMTAGNITMTAGDVALTNGSFTSAAGNLVLSTGSLTVGGASTFTGLATFDGATQHNNNVFVTNATVQISGAAGSLDMTTNRIINVGTPLSNDDAATKLYVDTAVGMSGADGVTYAGNVNATTGVITLNRTLGLPDVVLAGAAAPFTHTHLSSSIFHNVNPGFLESFLREEYIDNVSYPNNINALQVLNSIDQHLYRLTRRMGRQIFIGDGVTTTFTTASDYIVGTERLSVYVNGVKQTMSQFGEGSIDMSTDPNIGSDTGLAASTAYRINLTVNSTLYTNFQITTGATTPVTYNNLVNLIDAQLVTLSVPAICVFGPVTIITTTQGAGSNVTIAAPSAGTNLITSLTGTPTIFNSTITTNYAYKETGTPLQPSNSFVFAAAPGVGAVIEVLISQA